MLRAATTPVLLNVIEGYYIKKYRVLFTLPAVLINSEVSIELMYIYVPSPLKMLAGYSVSILGEIT
jgi:hypothetical protein